MRDIFAVTVGLVLRQLIVICIFRKGWFFFFNQVFSFNNLDALYSRVHVHKFSNSKHLR